jgi:hypothetical protein
MLLASQENFGGPEGASGHEDTVLRVDPHKILLKNLPKISPFRPMPGEENDIAISLRSFFDEPNFAFTKATNNI